MSIVVERVGPGATVQDPGRRGFMHLGVPRGGPLDPALFERVRASLGNAPEAASVELPWHRARFRALAPTVVSVDGDARLLADGEVFEVDAAPHAVRYVGLRGGVDVPVALGGRGTLLVAGVGGLDGRMLRAGDVLRAGSLVAGDAFAPSPLVRDEGAAIAIHVCDDVPAELAEALVAGAFEVTTRVDRVGMRLRGELPRLPHATGVSVPLVRGAIEATPDGELIVMGPDHPTTGGYAVAAVVAARDRGALAQRRPGAAVRFERFRARG
ncbi:MAG: hypothetical protein U0324_00780 [Polyangiales bacterium]